MKTSELSCAFMGYTYEGTPVYNITLVFIATLMLMFSLPTFIINICILISILRKSELHTPSFIVIFNLAISDCLAGCSAYVFYATSCIRFASGYDACPVAYVGTSWSFILGITSFNTITLQTIERYLAIFYPYWYHEKVTVKRTIAANTTTWMSSIAMVTFLLITEDNQAYNGIVASLSMILFVVTIICYILIFREVRRIEREMMKNQTASRDDRKKIRSESKVAKATVIILLAVVIFYSPALLLDFYVVFVGVHSTSSSIALYWAWFLVLINSFVNPLIACRQLSVLRRPVKLMLYRMVPCFKGREVTPVMKMTSFAMSRTSQTEINLGKRLSKIANDADNQKCEGQLQYKA